MSSPHDPARLSLVRDPAFADLEGGLREARESGPSVDQQLRMRVALGLSALPGVPNGGDAAGTDGAQATRAAVPHVPAWLKVLVGGVLALTAIGSFGALRQLGVASRPAPLTRPLPKAAASGTASVKAEPAASAAAVGPNAPAPASPTSPPELAPPPRPRRAAVPHAREQSRVPSQDTSASLAEELALLRRAKAHAVSEPERALALLDEHARRFAQGALAQEREVIAIEALLARGDGARAEQRAAEFLEQNPGSAHARRVRALLDGHDARAADFDAKPGVRSHPSR